MLAACFLLQQGTPFIYQGQELGMTNIALPSIDQYEDVASINAYHRHFRFASEKYRLHRIHISSRDSARTPMQWNGEQYAGFSTVQPWFHINPNYKTVNVEMENADPNSILNFYRTCLALRKSSETLLWGTYRELDRIHPKHYVCLREWKRERILVVCSFSDKTTKFKLPKGFEGQSAALLLCNYPGQGEPDRLRPWEVRVLRWAPQHP